MSEAPDIFNTDPAPPETEPLPELRPWYQRWLGWAIPSDWTLLQARHHTSLGLTVLLIVTFRFGSAFGLGALVAFLIGYAPVWHGGVVAMGILLLLPTGE